MKDFKGVFTALVTPFDSGRIDFESLGRLLDHQVKNGIDGFVVNGTTGESPTLKREERDEVYRFVRHRAPGKIVILGTGGNDTEKTVQATREAEQLGADAALVVVPYYNKPPQRGLFAHFKAVAESTKLPVILYNVPGRTVAGLATETIRDLAKLPNVIGVKEASGDIGFAREIAAACGPGFTMLSGDDGTYGEFLAAGGHGVISVATHVLPAEFVAWTRAAHRGDAATALAGVKKAKPLIDALFAEANPIPVKKALQMMGLLKSAELRLPLVELDPAKEPDLRREMKACGVIP